MAIIIQPYREEHQSAVNEFNQRLRQGGQDSNTVFYRYATPQWLPKTPDARIYQEYFVAVDNGAVRGGYALKHQEFIFPDGAIRSIGYYHHPLSEGIVNKSYALVGSLLLRDAMLRSPLLYCLGMNGYDQPLPKMLVSLGWSHMAVPFFFRVLNPSRFLREFRGLSRSFANRVCANIVASSGAGWAASNLFQSFRKITAPRVDAFSVNIAEEFAEWTDPLWQQGAGNCSMTAVRNSSTLRVLYPSAQNHFTRLRLQRNSADIGWAVLAEKRADAKYGEMRVGSLVDCWALPGEELSVTHAATEILRRQGLDLIVTNQSHREWGEACKNTGYLNGPSNFIFAASKQVSTLLMPFVETQKRMHFTRADGDGLPYNF